MAARRSKPPLEPVLNLGNVQGIVVPGFFKPHQTLIYLRFASRTKCIGRLKNFIETLSVSSGTITLKDRRSFRTLKKSGRRANRAPLIAIAFTYSGLVALTPGADEIPSPAFRNGMVQRSALLGDNPHKGKDGHPSTWKVGGPKSAIDALITVAGDTRRRVNTEANRLKRALKSLGVVVWSEDGDVRPDQKGHEHFGFDDGVSQPGIRGRATSAAKDFVTARHVATRAGAAAHLFGYPGQDLVWPGEFVFGYPATSPDPLVPGPIAQGFPSWMNDGSFLVFRRLRQNVALFWRTMRAEAKRLARSSGFTDLNDVALAARLVGRWKSGAPFSRVPSGDDLHLGKDKLANNNVFFDSDSPTFVLRHGVDRFPKAKADPLGLTCPLAAHIRKVNTRDSASDMGARTATYDRRVLRVGVPYGPSIADDYTDDRVDRGLLFLSIQTSIEEQFEFLQSRWINDAVRPKAPGGNDMIVGQNSPADSGIRKCVVFGSDLGVAEVRARRQWVTATGGAYLFVPSISTLRQVLSI